MISNLASRVDVESLFEAFSYLVYNDSDAGSFHKTH